VLRRSAFSIAALLANACFVDSLDVTGKTCSTTDLCPAPFTCVLDAGVGVCLQAPCDAGPPSGSCTVGRGICARTGTWACSAAPGAAVDLGSVFTCQGTAGSPRAETCDGTDEDCDGVVDDNLDAMAAPLCPLQLGVCAGAREACVDGGYVCTGYDAGYEPVQTVCNGIDTDCSGAPGLSKMVLLVPDAGELGWRRTPGGFEAIYSSNGIVSWRAFDERFAAVGSELALSAKGAPSTWPTLVSASDAGAALWVEQTSAPDSQQLVVALVSSLGVQRRASVVTTVSAPPRLAVGNDDRVYLAWVDDGGTAQAGTFTLRMPASQTIVPVSPSGIAATVDIMAGSPVTIGWLTNQNAIEAIVSETWDPQLGTLLGASARDAGYMVTLSSAHLHPGGLLWTRSGNGTAVRCADNLGFNVVTLVQPAKLGDTLPLGGSSAYVVWDAFSDGLHAGIVSYCSITGDGGIAPAGVSAPRIAWSELGPTTSDVAIAFVTDGGILAERVCVSP
jgi:hypothetical protein